MTYKGLYNLLTCLLPPLPIWNFWLHLLLSSMFPPFWPYWLISISIHRLTPSSGLVYLLISLPRVVFPWLSLWFTPSFPPGLHSYVIWLVRSSLTTLSVELKPTHTHTHTPIYTQTYPYTYPCMCVFTQIYICILPIFLLSVFSIGLIYTVRYRKYICWFLLPVLSMELLTLVIS